MKTQNNYVTWPFASDDSTFVDSATWAGFAYLAFEEKRKNGNKHDNPLRKKPKDGNYTWIKGEMKNNNVYGIKNAKGSYEYEIRYDPGPGDKKWMEEKDKNYLARIEREGKLKTLEPAVWYLREIDGTANMNIRDWWSKKLQAPNLSELLKNAEKNYRMKISMTFLCGLHRRHEQNSPVSNLSPDVAKNILSLPGLF